jgi:hypothetical protein
MEQWRKARILWRLDRVCTWIAVVGCVVASVAALAATWTGRDQLSFVMFGLAIVASAVANWHPVVFRINDKPNEDS